MKNYINNVAICGNDARRNAITDILKELEVKYEIIGKTTKNIVISFNNDKEQEKKIVVGAHYDAHDKTCPGANDNGAGCVILLNLIEELKETNLKVDFVFFDKEEQGGIGSREYIENVGRENIKGMINLDMCGLGSNIMVNPDALGTNVFSEYPFKGIIEDAPNVLTKAPGGDSTIFIMNRIPAIMIFNSTDNDLEWFEDFSNNKMPRKHSDFLETMHQDTDTADKFDATGMEMIYRYLLNHLKK